MDGAQEQSRQEKRGWQLSFMRSAKTIGEQVAPGRINPLSSQKEEITLLGEDKKVYRQMGESLPMVMNQGAGGGV